MRTISNVTMDAHILKLGDPSASVILWELHAATLADEEWAAIEALFHGCEGRLGKFTFLDPADNLLRWSEDFSAETWQCDPLLELTPGAADPLGGTRAVTIVNTSQTTQGITQSLDLPGDYYYCLSLYARSQQDTQMTLKRFSASHSEAKAVEVSQTWRRFVSSGNLGVGEEPVHFGLEVEAGDVVEVFGTQVEAQLAPSKYKRTQARGGVYANSRFLDDSLTLVTEGPDQHSSAIRIITVLED